MDAIVSYWGDHVGDIPDLKAGWIGWGEPFCFACGWLPPVADGRGDSWRQAAKWLDRAHLMDRCEGGPDEPFNVVPLCHLCHDSMPAMRDREQAIAWVASHADSHRWWQFYTDAALRGRSPGSGRSTILRARVCFLELVSEHLTGQEAS